MAGQQGQSGGGQSSTATASEPKKSEAKKKDDKPDVLRLSAENVDPALALVNRQKRNSRNAATVPASLTLRTYKVKPLGENTGHMETAIVDNCLDGGDAKAAYFEHYKTSPTKKSVSVELVGEKEFTLPEEK